jgi:tetratricopeptide (TPR) repeat protein
VKNNLLVIIALMFIYIGTSQNDNSEAIRIEKEVLNSARNIGDPAVAVNSLYRLIALEGVNSTYKDTLAYIYFTGRKYGPAFMMTTQVLERAPDHLEMLEMNAVSLDALGAFEKSAEVYEKLLEKTKGNFYGYTLSNLYYKMKKYEEAYTVIKNVETLNDEGKYKVTFSINQNHTQQVELIAAIPYLKGLIEIQLKNNAAAKLSFEKAVKIQPDFVLAQENLEAVEKFTQAEE